MMANPELSSTQEPGLTAVPPQGGPADTAAAPEASPEAEAPLRRSKASKTSKTSIAPEVYEPDSERMPLMARVLLADLAVAIVALVVLFVIEVQRFGDASLHLRREAWAEDLGVLFVVTAVFGVVTSLLIRARHTRVAIVQVVVTALVLAAAVTSAATGSPKPSDDTPVPVTSTGNPG